jgi:sugar phosphate isomerase/epimerase
MPTVTTKPGGFPIGFRQTGAAFMNDTEALIAFMSTNGFASIDLVSPRPRADLQRLSDAGLRVGTVDFPGGWNDWTGLTSPDAARRADTADRTIAYIASLAPLASLVFTVALAEDGARPRAENFRFAIDGYRRLCEGVARHGAKVLLEGWPGMAPHYASFGCTPADVRAMLAELPANAGINFDPSHLVRVGIDPLRFIDEFAPRIHHVHGKDTELFAEDLYQHGNLQPATFAPGHGWGGQIWRYCIPGDGQAQWGRVLARLQAVGYRGLVSIELEDERYCTGEEGEKKGLIAAQRFLANAAGATRAATA